MFKDQKTKHTIMFVIVIFVFIASATGVWAYQRYVIKECSAGDTKICWQTTTAPGANKTSRVIKNLSANKKYNLVVKKKLSDGSEVEVGTVPVDPAIKSDSSKCQDTDNGADYYKQGSLTWVTQKFNATDKCDGNTLTEYYCYGDSYKEVKFYCEGGCANGACKSYTAPAPNTAGGTVSGTSPVTPTSGAVGTLKWGEMCDVPGTANNCSSGLECKYSGRYGLPGANRGGISIYTEKYCCKSNECASTIPGTDSLNSSSLPHCVGNGGTDEHHMYGASMICQNGANYCIKGGGNMSTNNYEQCCSGYSYKLDLVKTSTGEDVLICCQPNQCALDGVCRDNEELSASIFNKKCSNGSWVSD